MNAIENTNLNTLEFEINTKYKGKIKEETRERLKLSLEYFVAFFIFVGFTIWAATDQFDVLRYEALQGFVIITLSLIAVGLFIAAFFAPFLVRHNRGLKGKIRFTLYKNENNELRCKCSGVKNKRNITFDEKCKNIKLEKYSFRIYYKTFKFFRIPLSQLTEEQISQIKSML